MVNSVCIFLHENSSQCTKADFVALVVVGCLSVVQVHQDILYITV